MFKKVDIQKINSATKATGSEPAELWAIGLKYKSNK
jgi:hypothetical protein